MENKIVHEQKICTACGVCVAISEKFWELGPANPKAVLKNAKAVSDNFELEISDEDLAQNKDAAAACPVNCIHIFDKKGEKLV